MMENIAHQQEAEKITPLSPEAKIIALGEASVEKMRTREGDLLEKASGKPEVMNRILELKSRTKVMVKTAVAAAAILSSSMTFAQDDAVVEKIADAPTLEAFGENNLPKIDMGTIEAATSGVQALVEQRLATVGEGLKKVAEGESLGDKIDGLEQATKSLPGKLGDIGTTIELGKKLTAEKSSGEDRLEAGGKILEIVGGKLGPLGSLLTTGLELKRDIREGKDGKQIAFKFLKMLVSIKTAGLSNLIGGTLVDMAERVTLTSSPTPSEEEMQSAATTTDGEKTVN